MKYLSRGTLQKAAAIQALLGNKDILFIDEPLSGQDTYLIEELNDRIIQIEDGNITDGTDYLYGSKITKCVFLIRNHKSNPSDFIIKAI